MRLIVSIFLLHGSLLLLPELLIFEYSCTPITLYTCSCNRNRNTDRNPIYLLYIINIVNTLAYLYSGIPVLAQSRGETCVELSATQSKVPHHTYT